MPQGGGGERILVVEDDPLVRRLARVSLERSGYRVLEAVDVAAALRLLEAADTPVDLVVSDVYMPGTTGDDFATYLLERYPKIRVLLTSGHVSRDAGHDLAVPFLEKPYTPKSLLRRVQEVLSGRS